QHAKYPDNGAETAAALFRRLRAASVAEDLVARHPAQQICDALAVLPARRCSNAAGWLVRAISDGWQLHDEAERLRAARTRQYHDDARAAEAQQEQRDRRLTEWAAAVSAALTDPQLTAAVDRVTTPADGLDRRSAPVAASQLLGWAITTATSSPAKPLHDVLTEALNDHTTDGANDSSTRPAKIPRPPATPDAAANPDAFRRRVRHAIDHLETANLTREPQLEGSSYAP
ncbi:MAG TPA: hypothetical protein VK875_08445, partial [Euzebyales bacterium]|nr:hypothetical protein [Euzebyales bacterium]